MLKTPAHVTISWMFLILIGIVFGYSYFFYSEENPDNHPVDCMVRQHTGRDCPTCGFSRAFSNYTHLKIAAGKNFNTCSWPVFLFFFFQFLLRGFIVIYYAFTKKSLRPLYIKTDVAISISGFLLAFLPILFKT